jgi:hypothetical protein
MINKIFFITSIICSSLVSIAQQKVCGTDYDYHYFLLKNPSLITNAENYKKKINAILEQHKLNKALDVAAEITIPVVIHVVYKNQYDSFSLEQINVQLARLNEDFNNLHSDFSKVPAAFTSVAGNMNLKFVLAKRDPNNNPTNGIEYHMTARDFNSNLPYNDPFMKKSTSDGLDVWNAQEYLNVWVCSIGTAIHGWSTKPDHLGQDPSEDGVVINTTAFGINNDLNNAGTNYGRTLTHEVGHWLGLEHIWGSAITTNGSPVLTCTDSDEIDDTPNQNGPNFGLHPPGYIHVSCSNGPAGDMWMNFMDYCDHLNRYLFTAGQVLRTRAVLASERVAITTSEKHLPALHQMSNAPFTTNSFTALAVGKDRNIWAGTNRMGLYRFNKTAWAISGGALDGYRINGMTNDKNGGIWIAQQGTLAGGAYASGGGVHYYPDGSSFTGRRYFSDNATNGLPSRSGRSVFVDTSFVSTEPRVWIATMNQLDPPDDVPKRGGIGLGLSSATPYFSSVTAGLDASVVNGGTYTIGGNKNEIFVFSESNFGGPQIIVYNAATGAHTGSFTSSNSGGALPAGFFARAIYGDVAGNKWVGLQSGGVAFASTGNSWTSVNYPSLFPAGSAVNNNACTGDRYGNVFIGTTAGLVMFNGTNVNDVNNFRLFTTTDGLPSNNVTALAIDSVLGKVVIGTDNGIAYWDKDCLMKSCEAVVPAVVSSKRNGNWNDPTVWSNGKVPDCNTIVMVYHTLSVNTTDATCYNLFAVSGSNTTITSRVTITNGRCD